MRSRRLMRSPQVDHRTNGTGAPEGGPPELENSQGHKETLTTVAVMSALSPTGRHKLSQLR